MNLKQIKSNIILLASKILKIDKKKLEKRFYLKRRKSEIIIYILPLNVNYKGSSSFFYNKKWFHRLTKHRTPITKTLFNYQIHKAIYKAIEILDITATVKEG